MLGSSKINVVAMLLSCGGNALILGGIIWGLSVYPQRRELGSASQPLVIELLPLKGEDLEKRKAAAAYAVRAAEIPGPSPAAPSSLADIAPKRAAAAVHEELASATAAETGVETYADGAPDTELLSDYQRRLNDLIARNARYPAEARALRVAGVTRLAFSLDRSGQVVESWIQKSSGSSALDVAALEALERAQPLPPMPAGLPARLQFVVEIDSSAATVLAVR